MYPSSGRAYKVSTPLDRALLERLRIGDTIYLNGLVFTARDSAHKLIIETLRRGERLPFDTKGLAVYHAGPIAVKGPEGWRLVAAGPTTSMRMESVEADFIELTGVGMIIGKGGMGARTRSACIKHGCVYAVFTGGAAVLAADRVERVEGVYWLGELGPAEAVWLLRVRDFGPLTVVIDSKGGDLYERVSSTAARRMKDILSRLKGDSRG
ncbi:MAG: fumarate hydratase [Hyperthermus sp.]|nr:MAG: fumarate hydratase [Hyperthermus sp.]